MGLGRARRAGTKGAGTAFPAELLPLVLIFAGASWYCAIYGRIGYMPLDQSIIFDGGWRLLSGQVPFRDFSAPHGMVPSLIQAACFSLFGVSWTVYCAHAAVVNGLFAAAAYAVLRSSGGSRWIAGIHALVAGVVFYPPFGVPYSDQHAWFFTLVLLLLALVAVDSRGSRAESLALGVLPLVALLGFLSKQIPTVFGVVLACGILANGSRRRAHGSGRALAVLCGGAMIAFSGLLLLFGALGTRPTLLLGNLIGAPLAVGSRRLVHLLGPPSRERLAELFVVWYLAIPVVVVALVAPLGIVWLRRRRAEAGSRLPIDSQEFPARRDAVSLSLSLGLLVTTFGFVALTNNEPTNGAAGLFVALGLVHCWTSRAFGAGSPGSRIAGRRGRSLAAAVASSLPAWLALGCAIGVDRQVNAPRRVHGLNVVDPSRLEAPAVEALSFLRLATPAAYGMSASDLDDVVGFFGRNPGNFFLLGDCSILYGLTGRRSVNPVLWYQPGLTVPRRQAPRFETFEDELLAALAANEVRYVVLETIMKKNKTVNSWTGLSLVDLPKLGALVERDGAVRAQFGPFTIVELGRAAGTVERSHSIGAGAPSRSRTQSAPVARTTAAQWRRGIDGDLPEARARTAGGANLHTKD